ncbi:hypothetical protein L3Y34_019530 [Caenorhabditis briggsae]|uniref:Uncharacterized protein n=1 Tax=Caenorhabditis briggsae TaxID=6238 RepID=A0AAE9DNX3_CAEBR|nr:hypothetical protein L3Y34_019530 [Caenorhabditis briggsae]
MQQAAAVPFNPSRPFPVECYANKLNHHVLGAGTNISKEQVKFIEAIAKNIRSSHTYFLEISKNPKSQVQIDELQRRLEEKENENSALKKQVMELTKKLCKMESEKENRISDFGNKDKIRIKARTAKKLDQEKLEKEENEDKKRIEILEAQIRHLKEDASILREYYEPSHFFKRLVKENEQLKTKILEKTTAMDRVMTENQKLKKTNDKALKNIDLLNENIEILKKKKKKKSSYGF